MTLNSKEVARYLASLFKKVYKIDFYAKTDYSKDWEVYSENNELMAYYDDDRMYWRIFPMSDSSRSVQISLSLEEDILEVIRS